MRIRLLVLLSIVGLGCGGESATEPVKPPVTPTHVLTASANLYCLTGTLIKDVEILVDDLSVNRQQSPQGLPIASLLGSKAFTTAGTHTVTIHMIDQTGSPCTYTVEGGAAGLNTTNNSQVTVLFPNSLTLGTGGKATISIAVP